ncbi:MAG: hypothetical protein HGB17_15185, partial [Syntrophobacteraceae bacterium]|nr:hypothetical protein [Syntrophobacteraceae bacterium]
MGVDLTIRAVASLNGRIPDLKFHIIGTGATSVQVIYRRTVDQMPADRDEIHELHEEETEVLELTRPIGLRVEDGRLTGLTCLRTEDGGARDAAGRKVPR